MTSPSSLEHQINTLSTKLTESIEHQERESKFAVEANDRFEKNIRCFEKYYKDIANTIKEFQTRDDFCLHVTTTGYGNFVPNGLEAPIYSDDPITQTKEQVEAQTKNSVFSLTDYTGYPKNTKDPRLHIKYMTELSKVMCSIRDEKESNISELPEYFPSAIIFGIGLGYHIPLLLERTEFEYIFLIEPDFEQFFASLFCTNWYEVIEKVDEQGGCLFFHLGIDHSVFIKSVEKIAEDVGAFSLVRSFCYQHTPEAEVNKLIQSWYADYFKFQFGHGFYNDAITGMAHSIHHVNNKVPILTKNSVKIDFETPIFIVGNGPSLDEAESYLKDNQGAAIVVAAGTAISSLHRKGVVSDFHVLVERPYHNFKIFGDILPEEEYKKVNLLGLNVLYPDTNSRYQWSGIAVKGNEAGTSLMDVLSLNSLGKTLPKIPFCNPVVVNTALSFFLYMGFRNIYLFGVDNGKQPEGLHHSKDSIYKIKNEDCNTTGYNSMKMAGRKLQGNLGGHVISNELFLVAHMQIEQLFELYKVNNIINVGNGAKLKHSTPASVDDLIDLPVLQNKTGMINHLKSDFFTTFPVDCVSDDLIGTSQFQDICDHIIKIASEEVRTIAEASKQLRRQSRYLYSLKGTRLEHLYQILKGSLLYYHCPMLTVLHQYKSQDFSLRSYHKLNVLWRNYVRDISAHYSESYMEKCAFGA
ncbi:septum formation inhibitor Maf [Pseudoalteromonas citrea]|uniref:Septum formation inhibitor Maf n=1 Tax=Pseudoalteromonas citrea TaxID=43655 RepID=A0A5S3XWM1_9GAMM|nr:6-hydroxymethylpterin diphosphokinase MptE-like protein [Pseudoalteromonas citrea]TMP41633.1 septum formation inhibitor Maf [Pseudoalteromonas citrea]TMP62533.1 septum formation inhibitor Maf [Pseudoalteromonas citrea]